MIESIALIYVSGVVATFVAHRRKIIDTFSDIVWHMHPGVKRKVWTRSALWFIPARLYYWREIAWEREKDQYEYQQ